MRIKVVQGPHAGREFIAKTSEVIIGRHPEVEVALPLDGRVSRRHARLREESGRLWLEDLQSTNGTFLNDKRITTRCEVFPGARVRVGDSVLEVATEVVTPEGRRSALLLNIVPEGLQESTSRIDVEVSMDEEPKTEEELGAEELLRRLEAIQRANQTVAEIVDPPRLLGVFMDLVFDVLSPDRGFVLLFDEETHELRPEIVQQRPGLGGEEKILVSQAVVERVLEERTGVLLRDAQHDVEFGHRQSIQALNIQSALCVPLIYQDESFGVIHVDTLDPRRAFSVYDLELLRSLANIAALCLHTAQLHREMAKAAVQRNNIRRYFAPQVAERILRGEEILGSGGERREVTVLYTDLRGFTAMTEPMDPAEVVSMMSDYFAEMTPIIFRYDGTVDNYIGDAILAVFGSPLPDERQTEKAVTAAVRMQKRLQQWNRKRVQRDKPPLGMGIGIARGEVIHGNVGSHERLQYTVMGDTVNTASRLVDAAAAGEILINDRVQQCLGDLFKVEPLPPMHVKGKQEELQVYRVLYEESEIDTTGRLLLDRLMVSGRTDVGQVRGRNEDALFYDEAQGIFIVADGLGGRTGGEECSQLVVKTLEEMLKEKLPEIDSGDIPALQQEAIRIANQRILEAVAAQPELKGMGSTLALLVVQERVAYLAHVGDARIYLFREEELKQLTADHSVSWMLYERGDITAEQLRRHHLRSVLTRCLGKEEEIEADTNQLTLQREDRLLLCTDGLWEALSEQELTALLRGSETPAQACERLIARANEHGGRDNITVIVIDVQG